MEGAAVNCRYVGPELPRMVTGRHEPGCLGECEGCLECPDDHCLTCGRNHAPVTCSSCLTEARNELDEVLKLCGVIPVEMTHKGVHGEIMMIAGPVANPEAWRHHAMSAVRGRLCKCTRLGRLCPELFGKTCPDVAYLQDCTDELHPLWVLVDWSDRWREALDQPTDLRVTLERAAAYLHNHLHEAAGMLEPDFSQFAKEIRQCRWWLEDRLKAGVREERTKVPCPECNKQLIKVWADKAKDDHWKCPRYRCQVRLNAEEFARAKQRHLASEWADKFVRVTEALAAIDRPEQTVRAWMRSGKVETKRDDTGAVWVWWPDVRHMHITTPTRNRRSA